MPKAYLVNDDKGEKIPLPTHLIIGRTKECGLILEDPAVSRKHIELKAKEGGYIWKDLGSTNGTYINGQKMLLGELHPGDLIQIGKTTFRFEIEQNKEPTENLKKESEIGDQSSIVAHSFLSMDETTLPSTKQQRANLLLETLCKVINEIATNFNHCELQNKIIEATSRVLPIDHGAILLTDENGNVLPCPQCQRVHQWEGGHLISVPVNRVSISSTVIYKVVKERQSLLYQDIMENDDLKKAVSIISLNVQSVICAPLRAKEKVIGLLYMDTVSEQSRYTEEELLLASAVGNAAGLAMENVRIYQELIEKYRLDQELKTAAVIQQGFLFDNWKSIPNNCDMYARTLPAKVVGGDFYDVILLPKDKIGFIVGDVSGKGMPASLAMVRLLTEFRIQAQRLSSQVDVINALNEDLFEYGQQGMFCSLCYVVVDIKTGEISVVNAGHLPTLWLRNHKTDYCFHPSGPPLGVLPNSTWKVENDILSKEDSILLFTDGIIEARNEDNEKEIIDREFGIDRLKKMVETIHFENAEQFVQAILSEVQKHTEPNSPHDDCTLLLFRWLNHA
ncbi:MAG TPA: SpoIIE family protein phosphatase [Candidatus Hydrogenedens sp.]|nr:SpoIIE family protein phosphatase [Candidatus Hydrogenedens sp.]